MPKRFGHCVQFAKIIALAQRIARIEQYAPALVKQAPAQRRLKQTEPQQRLFHRSFGIDSNRRRPTFLYPPNPPHHHFAI